MLINLTDILSSEGKIEEKAVSFEADVFTCQHGTFPLVDKSQVKLKLTNVGQGKAIIEANFQVQLVMSCDRCLKEVLVPLQINLMEEVSEKNIESPANADEQSYLEGYQLDVDQLIGNEILMNWPTKVLCSEDCKGICTNCGRDLNLGDCGCDTFVPDPRMAVIKDIFNANKEV